MKNKEFKAFQINYGVSISENMGGKMKDVLGLSTSCLFNKICLERMKDGNSICSHCYAESNLLRYGTGEKNYKYHNMKKNTEILTTRIIPVGEWPLIFADIFRLEMFGDIQNTIQVENYFNFAETNPAVTFALWTKNPSIIARVLIHREKPSNLIIVYSSPILNELDIPPYSFIDKYFTVYDKEHAKDHNINCGARDCNACRRCYSKDTDIYIKEVLK